MAENNADNRGKLAEAVVDDWDMEQLLDFAIQQQITIYQRDDEAFQEDWGTVFGGTKMASCLKRRGGNSEEIHPA